MGRIIAFLSGKGGVGKTTLTAGLGEALAELGASVCMVDFDFGLNNLDLVLNLEDKVVYDLGDCLAGRCRIKQALISQKQKDNIYFMSSGKITSLETVNQNQVVAIIEKLSKAFDYCLIDCPAGGGNAVNLVKTLTSEVVLVVTPNLSSLRDAGKVKNLMLSGGLCGLGVVVNRIRGDLVVSGKMLDEMQISNALGLKLVGVVPDSDEISILGNLKSVYDCGTQVRIAFDIIAKNIHHNKTLRFDYLSKYRGLLGTIKCKLKRHA